MDIHCVSTIPFNQSFRTNANDYASKTEIFKNQQIEKQRTVDMKTMINLILGYMYFLNLNLHCTRCLSNVLTFIVSKLFLTIPSFID